MVRLRYKSGRFSQVRCPNVKWVWENLLNIQEIFPFGMITTTKWCAYCVKSPQGQRHFMPIGPKDYIALETPTSGSTMEKRLSSV